MEEGPGELQKLKPPKGPEHGLPLVAPGSADWLYLQSLRARTPPPGATTRWLPYVQFYYQSTRRCESTLLPSFCF